MGKDPDGNMTTRTNELTNEVTTYQWDDFDRLLKVSSADGGGPTSTLKELNRYDVNGIRKRKMDKNNNSSTEYTAGISTVASESASSGSSAPTISYIMGHQLLGAEVNGNFQFFLTDALGTVRDVVDDSGDVIQSYEFDPHGNPMPGSGASSGTFSPKTYQGALSVNDDTADSGLYMMGFRHFDSSLGRFISRDPIGFKGGLNLFGTGFGNNPVTFVDPEGLMPTAEQATGVMYVVGGTIEIIAGAAATQADGPVIGAGDVAGAAAMREGYRNVGKGMLMILVPGLEDIPQDEDDDDGCKRSHVLHRAVPRDERDSINFTGQFTPNPAGSIGKYFYPTRQQAVVFANSRFNQNNPVMWRATGVLPAGTPHDHINPGTEGPAIFVHNPYLCEIRQVRVRERIK